MDTKTLISDVKARYSHSAATAQLKDKYKSKLIVADQGGLWLACPEILSFLNTCITEEVILLDTFENPVKGNRAALRDKLLAAYTKAMDDWYVEWKEAEKKR